MKVGVIIGRFQSPYIHHGYEDLIEYIRKNNDKLVIVVGGNETKFTNKNPLSFETRKVMLSKTYPYADILYLQDTPLDSDWSASLDLLLSPYNNVTLYGSRDSFISCYTGVNKTEEYNAVINISSSTIREKISKIPPYKHNKSFRSGIVYAVENKYPITFPTVDIAIVNVRRDEIILGKKRNNSKLCFPGGFVDRKDKSFEHAAIREFSEEVTDITIHSLNYVSSHQVDDWRYRGCSDGIITSFFTGIGSGIPKASDDLETAEWYNIKDFDINNLQSCHHVLFESLIKYLQIKYSI